MDDSDFLFTAEDFEGCRLIRAVMPAVVTLPTLSAAIARYLALWDTGARVVTLNDASRLARIPDEAVPVLLALVKRNAAEARFVGSAWVTGGNDVGGGQLRALFAGVGRDPNSVFATEGEALAYLGARVAPRPAPGGPA